MYPIDLETILRVLSHQSGELRATVKQIAGIKGDCQALVLLSAGKVVSCMISYNGTSVLSGEEAFRTLAGKGMLEWDYVPTPSPSSTHSSPSQMSPRSLPLQMSPRLQSSQERASLLPQRQDSRGSISLSMIPVQTQKIAMEDLATWPRPYRFVYQLATGEKTLAEIAQLLSLTPQQMNVILRFLVERGLVSLK